MAVETRQAGGMKRSLPTFSGSLSSYLMRLLALAVIDCFAIWIMFMLFRDGVYPLAVVLAVITVLINAIFLREDLYPLRWMAPGLALLILMVIYPILFTVYVAFTNYGEGHLLPKPQTVRRLQQTTFLDENAVSYDWTAFRDASGAYGLLLQNEAGEQFFALPNQPLQPLAEVADVGTTDEEGIPDQISGYSRVARRELGTVVRSLEGVLFGEAPGVIQLNPQRPTQASSFSSRYQHDPVADTLTDQQTGTVYTANDEVGYYQSPDGAQLSPGYRTVIGLANFQRVFTSPALRGPFLRVFLWTFGFAISSVALTFSLGLMLAIAFNNPEMKGRKLIRSILIIPYAIPGVITVLMWRGLLNPTLGPINEFLNSVFGIAPQWFADPNMAKLGILLVNLWLGYPYMMLISTGALAAVPSDIYEAAAVDGASAWQKFRDMTLPLILVSLGPLLISSFAFNLNNFNVIFLYAEGGPPISGATVPTGHTDILISYTYRLAFGGSRGADYGFASAITIFIFFMVATITFFQFRYTKTLEEISENV